MMLGTSEAPKSDSSPPSITTMPSPPPEHRRASLARPLSPANWTFRLGGSSSVSANGQAMSSSKANSRSRTVSAASKTNSVRGESTASLSKAETSSWRIDNDPFAANYNPNTNNSSFTTYPTPPSSTTNSPSDLIQQDRDAQKKRRGSILGVASDALSSFTRRRPKTVDSSHPQGSYTWKGKSKDKSKWALQPPTILPGVIEISAPPGNAHSRQLDDDDDEQKERERLREAAAQSIGIDLLIREGSSSRLGSVSLHDDRLTQESDVPTHVDTGLHPPDNLTITVPSSAYRPGSSPKNTLRLFRATSSNARPSTALSLGPPTPVTPTDKTHSRTPSTSLPPFPCDPSALKPFQQLSSTMHKHYPWRSMMFFSSSRHWRQRYIVLTSVPKPRPARSPGFAPTPSPFGRLDSTFSNRDRASTNVYHLHLFKSLDVDEKELERLKINEESFMHVGEEEVAGKRAVVKVGGIEIGAHRDNINEEANGQVIWLLHTTDAAEAQKWITTVKKAVLGQMAEKAGIEMPNHQPASAQPTGDMDVMLKMHALGFGTSFPHSDMDSRSRTSLSPSPPSEPLSSKAASTYINHGAAAATFTNRSSQRPNTATSALRSLFANSRPRSPSAASVGSSTTDHGDPSLAQTAHALLKNSINQDGLTGINGTSSQGTDQSAKSKTSDEAAAPELILARPIVPNLESVELPADHEFDDFSAFDRRSRVPSLPTQHSLLPPPRSKRAWTVSNVPGSEADKTSFSAAPPAPSTPSSSLKPPGSHNITPPATTSKGFGTPEHNPRRESMSSVSSLVSARTADKERTSSDYTPSTFKRRSQMGKVPRMQAPPKGPPPSVPFEGSSPPPHTSPNLHPDSVSIANSKRASGSSAISLSSISGRILPTTVMSSKRASMPPPPRPAPTAALPPTPLEVDINHPPHSAPHRKTTFKDSISQRALKISLPHQNEPSLGGDIFTRKHRRSMSSTSVNSKTSNLYAIPASPIPSAPRAPPPTGPLPPPPTDIPLVTRHSSIKQRLRIKSIGSSHPPVNQVPLNSPPPAPFRLSIDTPEPPLTSPDPLGYDGHLIGEPITTMQNDPNFLNMSPTESEAPVFFPESVDNPNFLHLASPVVPDIVTSFSSRGHSTYSLLEDSSPTKGHHISLSPPPRRNGIPISTSRRTSETSHQGFNVSPASSSPIRIGTSNANNSTLSLGM